MHELGYTSCPKSYVFRGSKDYTTKQITDMLGLNPSNRPIPRPGQPLPPQSFGASRFLMPVQQCEFQLTAILEGLERDPWPVANDKRPLRCTGGALNVAVGLLEVRLSFPCRTGRRFGALTLSRAIRFLCPDHVPQHWSKDHALRWRTGDRGSWTGRRT